jgi:hypothetical protein
VVLDAFLRRLATLEAAISLPVRPLPLGYEPRPAGGAGAAQLPAGPAPPGMG